MVLVLRAVGSCGVDIGVADPPDRLTGLEQDADRIKADDAAGRIALHVDLDHPARSGGAHWAGQHGTGEHAPADAQDRSARQHASTWQRAAPAPLARATG